MAALAPIIASRWFFYGKVYHWNLLYPFTYLSVCLYISMCLSICWIYLKEPLQITIQRCSQPRLSLRGKSWK